MQRIDRYELGRLLGEGGSGRVYDAVLRGPGGFRKPVALKVLHGAGAGLVREARLGGLLRHRNLVDVFEIGHADGRWFCAMELCAGSLTERLPLSPRAVVEVGLQICDALQYAHEELGLVHLDLKPANLLWTHNGTVKVADLGIARAEGFAGDGRTRGTHGYMPPEQIFGGHLDARADVFALGVTLVELATGHPPRASATVDLGELDAMPAPPIEPPDWLAPVVKRCLEPEAADRWPTMAAVATALRKLDAQGEGLEAWTTTPSPAPRPGEIPADSDAFVGRSRELEQVEGMLAEPGILTIKGPAGMGKSRLARAAALRFAASGDATVRACDLSESRTPDGLRFAVARALGLRAVGDTNAGIGAAIATRGRFALLLDNFDPMVPWAPILEGWAQAAPEARFVVTSREPLGLAGEVVVELGPLDAEAAVALVVERARARGVEADDDHRLRTLVSRLDGLPLALELAAGRLGVLSVDDVLDRLSLSLLRAGSEGRHGTLRAALDWSFGMLSPAEREALAQLSAFSGGFELEMAEEVLKLDGAALEAIDGLVRRSMVRSGADGRFELLSSVQSFAAEHRTDEAALFRRHAEAFARLGSPEALDALDRHGSVDRHRALAKEADNLVAACRRAVQASAPAVAIGTLRAAWRVLDNQGPYAIAADLAEAVLHLDGLDAGDEVHALVVASTAHNRAGAPDRALSLAEQAVRRAAGRGRALEGLAERNLGQAVYKRGDMPVARATLERSVQHARAAGARVQEGAALGDLANVLRDQGHHDEAVTAYRDALAIHREVGNVRQEAIVLGNLGILLRQQGDTDQAMAAYQRVLALNIAVGDRSSEGATRGSLAVLHQHQGRFDDAMGEYQEALRIHRELGDRRFQGVALGNIATLLHGEGRIDEAKPYYAASAEALREAGDHRYEGHVLANLANLARDEGRLDEARAKALEALAVAERVRDPRLEGYVSGRLAVISLGEGDEAEAGRWLARGEALLRGIRGGEVLAELLAVKAQLAARVGDRPTFEAAVAEALALAPESRDVRRGLDDAHAEL